MQPPLDYGKGKSGKLNAPQITEQSVAASPAIKERLSNAYT